jgi:hypothetical protein
LLRKHSRVGLYAGFDEFLAIIAKMNTAVIVCTGRKRIIAICRETRSTPPAFTYRADSDSITPIGARMANKSRGWKTIGLIIVISKL